VRNSFCSQPSPSATRLASAWMERLVNPGVIGLLAGLACVGGESLARQRPGGGYVVAWLRASSGAAVRPNSREALELTLSGRGWQPRRAGVEALSRHADGTGLRGWKKHRDPVDVRSSKPYHRCSASSAMPGA